MLLAVTKLSHKSMKDELCACDLKIGPRKRIPSTVDILDNEVRKCRVSGARRKEIHKIMFEMSIVPSITLLEKYSCYDQS
jgi:hypothetical protein